MDCLRNAVTDNVTDRFEEHLCQCMNETPNVYKDIVNKTLIAAVELGRLQHTKLLIENGADINHEDQLNQSVLWKSILDSSRRDPDVVKLLLLKGANINHKGRNGQTDFIDLAQSGIISNGDLLALLDCLDDIQERSLTTGGSYLHILSERTPDDGKLALLGKVVDKGVSVNARDNHDDTPMHIAAQIACYETMKFLIERGADINARNRVGESVMHSIFSAVEEKSFYDALKLLLKHGLDINDTDFQGRTLLHSALLMEKIGPETVEVLLQLGLKVNVKDVDRRNEMFYALTDIDFNILDVDIRTDVIKTLVRHSVSINSRDVHGFTPLHLAVQLDDLDLLDTLIELGADCTLKTNTGITPLHLACKHYNMVHVMIWTYRRNHEDLNMQDSFGSTSLHWSIWYRNVSAAQSLLQAGADVSIKDTFGDTPKDLAAKLDIDEFNTLLEDYSSLEPLELRETVIEHTDKDSFATCPLLRYVELEDDCIVCFDKYKDHLRQHDKNITTFINKVLKTQTMGLYYDIRENTSIQETIKSLMSAVAAKVSIRSQLFSCQLKLAGSTFEGTKVKLPDEFDYLWILTEFSDAFAPLESSEFPEGFVKLRLKPEVDESLFAEFLDADQCLDSYIVIRTFFKLINEEVRRSLQEDDMFLNIICLDYLREIWCSISHFKFRYFGAEIKDLVISIYIVPTIVLCDWVPARFPVEKLAPPEDDDDDDIKYSIVFKTPDRLHVKDFTRLFRMSYAFMEQRLFRCFPEYAMKGYILLKALGEAGYIPRVIEHNNRLVKRYITSYFFKTCALHVYEQLTCEESGEDHDRTAIFFARAIVNYLDKCLSQGCLPTYFDPNKNLIGVLGLKWYVVQPGAFSGLLEIIRYLLDVFETHMPGGGQQQSTETQ